MSITPEDILNALRHVKDPDLGKDLVTLNMVKDITINGKKIAFKVVLTTPACPLKEQIRQDCEDAIHQYIADDTEVDIDVSSDVTSFRKDAKVLLPGVKNIIAVASGKGGVGKSTVAVNLALGLAKNGANVGLLDADIYGPSVPLMLQIKGKKPFIEDRNGKATIIPVTQYGIKALSIGLLVDEKQAVVWRGPMVSSALKQFVGDCDWGELDYLIIDLPPGTGDIHLTLVQTVPVTGVVVVTTPQEVAMADARKAIGMFSIHPINVPIIGVVENMSYFTPAELPSNKYYIFGKGGGQRLATEFNVPFLGEIPLVQSIREGGDSGVPIVLGDDKISTAAFLQLENNTAQQVSIRNAMVEPSKKVEVIV